MECSYKITIEQTRLEARMVQGDYTTIDTEEVERESQFVREGESPTRIKEIYGYPPKIERQVETTVTVLEQTVNDLDLIAVIKAINGIGG